MGSENAQSSAPLEPLVGPDFVGVCFEELPEVGIINQWREWVKSENGSDSYAVMKHKTIDRIFDAAIVGMVGIGERRDDVRREMAAMLRLLAKQMDDNV